VVPTADVMPTLRSRSWVAQRFQRCDQRMAWSTASAAEVPRETKSKSSHADGQESRARTRRNIPEPQTNAWLDKLREGWGEIKIIGGRMKYGQTRSSGF
jgi:hypothetical protein